MGLTLFRKDIVGYHFIHKASSIFVVTTNRILFPIIVVSPEKLLGFGHEVAFFYSEGPYKCPNCPFSALFYLVEPWHLGVGMYREELHIDREPWD